VFVTAAGFPPGATRIGATCAGGEDPHVPPQPPDASGAFLFDNWFNRIQSAKTATTSMNFT
jgi:hypothetical protein